MAILRKRKVQFKSRDEEPEETAAHVPVQRTVKRDMRHMDPEDIEKEIDAQHIQMNAQQDDKYPLPEDLQEPIDENHVIMRLIQHKKETLGSEKIELKGLQNQVQTQLKTLETKIKTHYDEIQALEYIASGEPTMTIVDIIDIINDFKNDRTFKTPEEVLEAMQKTILKSTLESIRQ